MPDPGADTSTATCKYPGCENPPEPATGPGRPREYCADPAHTPVSAWRERKRLADAERGIITSQAETEQPVTMARVTGAEMLRQMRELAGQLAGVADRLTGAVTTLGDPAAAEAEVDAVRSAAERRAVTAEAERDEHAARAVTADELRAAADAAAEEMGEQLAAAQAQAAAADERLAEAVAAHAAELEQVRQDTQARADEAIQRAEADADAAVSAAETRIADD